MNQHNIPNGWKKGKLSELIHSPESGGRPKGGANGESGEIPSIGAEFITRDGRLNFEGMKFIPKEYFYNMNSGILKLGDILICKDGALTGKVAFYDTTPFKEAAVNGHVFILRPNNGDSAKFIFYVLQSDAGQNKIRNIMTGSAQPGINTTFPKYYDLLIPTKKEQERIAEILSIIDENIFETDKIIEGCEQVKKGLMQTLLIKGILGRHKKLKKTEIGEIPEKWELKKLEDVGIFLKGKRISKSQLLEEGLPCVRYGELYTVHHFVIKKFYSFIDRQTASESEPLKNSDLLLAGSGETVEEIGKCAVYLGNEKAYAGGDVIIFRDHHQDGLFMSYLLNSNVVRQQLNKLGQGHAVVHIYPYHLSCVLVPLPSLNEQREISATFSAIDRRMEKETERKESLMTIKKSLMQKLLSGELKVKV